MQFSIDQENKERITWSNSLLPKSNCNQEYVWNWETEILGHWSYVFVFMYVQTSKSVTAEIFLKDGEKIEVSVDQLEQRVPNRIYMQHYGVRTCPQGELSQD